MRLIYLISVYKYAGWKHWYLQLALYKIPPGVTEEQWMS